jgi:hypothetical protein
MLFKKKLQLQIKKILFLQLISYVGVDNEKKNYKKKLIRREAIWFD